jgi:RNA polymerase sigma-70 factor (ECF subfamily)
VGNDPEDSGPGAPRSLESTASLIEQIRGGDRDARNRLAARYLDPLRRWARGQVPARARDLTDTDDLVQMTLHAALDRVEAFEYRRDGAFAAYLRRILQNKIRDQARRMMRRPEHEELHDDRKAENPTPLEEAIGRERVALYERGLSRLSPKHREMVVLRVELGFTFDEIAREVGSPSSNAARMAVSRALVRLAEVMDEE